MTRHGIQVGSRSELQPLSGKRPDRARRAIAIVFHSRRWVDQMRVAIDKTWQDDPAGGIDFNSLPRLREVFESAARAHLNDNPIPYQNSAVRYYA